MIGCGIVSLLFSSLLLSVTADDFSFCKDKCQKKFTEEAEQNSCNEGCTHRSSISQGSRGFLDCHLACDAAHANATVMDGQEEKMKVDYGNGDAAPRVEVVRKEGGDVGEEMRKELKLLLNPEEVNGNIMKNLFGDVLPQGFSSESESTSEEKQQISGPLSELFKIKTGNSEFDRLQDKMHEMMRSFMARADVAMRPQGHDKIAMMGPEVGNEDENGRELIVVGPVSGVERDGFELPWIREENERAQSFSERQDRFRSHFPALFQWVVCLVLLIAISCTIVVALLILRHMRMHRYAQLRSAMSAQSAAHRAEAAAGGAMSAGALPKKVPLELDAQSTTGSLPEPTGVPPPAYDQISVHSKH